MSVASGDHALRVEYVNARPVFPEEEAKAREPERGVQTARPLGKVFYRDLGDGVSLIYENHDSGVVKSTYRVEAAETRTINPVDQIRLRLNMPIKVDQSGDLIISFMTGEMRESRPVAWQEMEGNRVSVEVQYRLMEDREVGFQTGPYDPRYPLVICFLCLFADGHRYELANHGDGGFQRRWEGGHPLASFLERTKCDLVHERDSE